MSEDCNQKPKVGTKEVKITYNLLNSGKAEVNPPHALLNPKDTVVFVTKNTAVTIFFPTDLFKNEKGTKFKVIRIESDGWKALNLKDKINTGNYPYAIYCEKTGDFIEVNSSPSMIIIED